MKGKNRRFAGYRLEEIWADPDEIRGTVEKMEMNYPGNGGKVFVIVEGPYDLEVYDRCFNRDSTILRIANSKENVRDVVADILAQSGEGDASHIIGIIDSDFSLFTGSGIKGKNLFITDTHDLETMLIASPALDRVIEHVAAGAIPQSFSQRVQGDLRGPTCAIRSRRRPGTSALPSSSTTAGASTSPSSTSTARSATTLPGSSTRRRSSAISPRSSG